MKICPKCKNEYRDGIKKCAECDCELVDITEEKNTQKAVAKLPYPHAEKIVEYLKYCKYEDISTDEPDEEGNVVVYCKEEDYKEALKQVQIFVQEESKRIMEEKLASMSEEELQALKEEEEQQQVFVPSNVYQNYEVKAEENKSSAYSFLVVGILGVIVVILSWFEVLPFSIGGAGNWLSHGVMMAIFIIFVIVGIVSAKSVGKYKTLAGQEADHQSELTVFLEEAFSYEVLSEITADSEEEAYFKRMQYMREEVSLKYAEQNLDASFVESLLDAHYDKIFG